MKPENIQKLQRIENRSFLKKLDDNEEFFQRLTFTGEANFNDNGDVQPVDIGLLKALSDQYQETSSLE